MSFSLHRFLIEGFNEVISIQVYVISLIFPTEVYIWRYLRHIHVISSVFPIGVFEKVLKTYNYNYDPQIIFIMFSKLGYRFFLPRFPILVYNETIINI